MQMLPQRLARASALRNSMGVARRMPIIQRRTFFSVDYTDKKLLDQKYPEGPDLSPAQDPEMVSYGHRNRGRRRS